MTPNFASFGLAIDSPLATPNAANFRPPSWPPPRDWPVTIDANGSIVSRYKDSIWRLDPWAKQRASLNFGDGRVIRSNPIDALNADLLRQISAWWIWGPRAVQTTGLLCKRFINLRPLFVLCFNNGILASDLMRFPTVADQIAGALGTSVANDVLTQLHELYEHREVLGFTLLDRDGLTRLEAALPDHEHKQTAYIPPRIWMYQVRRLRECLDDFLAHSAQVEACYKFCLDAYAKNCGSLEAAVRDPALGKNAPFSQPEGTASRRGLTYYGPFTLTAARFGIDKLLSRWVGPTDADRQDLHVKSLSSYFCLLSQVGLAYLSNFSLMRIAEGWSLKADCLEVENDPRFGDIYILRGSTTKTKQDDNARWPTSPSAKVAIDAMACIARLQLICTKAQAGPRMKAEEMRNPYLIQRCVAPWRTISSDDTHYRLQVQSYEVTLVRRFSKLFDLDELRITEDDLQVARLITPTLNHETFAVGKIWPFAWHQLRRTGAVNMQASGLVSDASLQYLLKHVTRAMSLYYGQGYSRLRLNDEARIIYVRTMYEILGKEFARLLTDRFVSPHGEKRKIEIVRLIDPRDAKKLTTLAKKGQISCREILLGYCMNKEPCPYGGIDSVAHCGGGDSDTPCPEVLYDKGKAPNVKLLDEILNERLIRASRGSPLHESLLAQKRSVENYQNVIKYL